MSINIAFHRGAGRHRQRSVRTGFTLYELLVAVLAIAALVTVAAVMMPRRRCGAPSTRLVCASNVKGLGTSLAIYANENQNSVPMPAFDETRVGGILYTIAPGAGQGTRLSPGRTQPSVGGAGGAVELSTTRSLWMLVRSGDITTHQFICPTSGDVPENADRIDAYYDFSGYKHVSYGLQVPFGPPETRPRMRWAGADNRMVLAADKGPYVDATISVPPEGLTETSELKAWRPFNSRNHGGEGQNVLFADGHVSFARTPIVGIDLDNIYTAALDNVNASSRIRGESPWVRNAHPFAPRDAEGKPIASTDTLIYP